MFWNFFFSRYWAILQHLQNSLWLGTSSGPWADWQQQRQGKAWELAQHPGGTSPQTAGAASDVAAQLPGNLSCGCGPWGGNEIPMFLLKTEKMTGCLKPQQLFLVLKPVIAGIASFSKGSRPSCKRWSPPKSKVTAKPEKAITKISAWSQVQG